MRQDPGGGDAVARRAWIAGVLLGVAPLLGAQEPVAPPAAAHAAPQEEQAATAHRAYLERLAPQLAGSGQPRALAFAALLRDMDALAESSAEGNPPDADAQAWRRKAFSRAGADVVALALLVAGADAEDAVRADAAARWRQVEPSNLAAWLSNPDASPQQVLEAARTAARVDGHMYAQLRWILQAHRDHPPSPAEAARIHGGGNGQPATLDDFAAIHGMALLAATATPRFQPLLEFCRRAGTQAPGSMQAQDCRRAGELLMSGDTFLVRMTGLALADGTARDAVERGRLAEARRRFDWQMLQWGRLSGSAPGGGIGDFVRLLRDPAIDDEPALVERLLREAGIPLDPPAGWRAPNRRN
ncbi:hypothetical protein [Luteimonas sp. R10]|uniref:hypothetical protein n=1 Tax=Luteimonas sp. R10 TaxID=3108176 RepID=UPI003087F4DC|nr:hypothetical protein U3649_03830 [Luteimonas sp. R10]